MSAFGVVCVCVLCEQPIPWPMQNAAIFSASAAGTKHLCPVCVYRTHMVRASWCHQCSEGGAFYRDGSDLALCRSCEAGLGQEGSPAGGTGDTSTSTAGGDGIDASAKNAENRLPPLPPQLVVERGELLVVAPGRDPVPVASWVRERRAEMPDITGGVGASGHRVNGGVGRGH